MPEEEDDSMEGGINLLSCSPFQYFAQKEGV